MMSSAKIVQKRLPLISMIIGSHIYIRNIINYSFQQKTKGITLSYAFAIYTKQNMYFCAVCVLQSLLLQRIIINVATGRTVKYECYEKGY